MNRKYLIATLFWLSAMAVITPPFQACAGEPEPQLVSAFSPIAWGMSEKEIRKVFAQYEIEPYEPDYQLIDENGKEVSGKSEVMMVHHYPVFGGLTTATVSFHRRGSYYKISIDSDFNGEDCELMPDEEFVASKQCQTLAKKYAVLRKEIFVWFRKAIPVKPRKHSEAEREADGPGETWEWQYNGIRYIYDWGEGLGFRFGLSVRIFKLPSKTAGSIR